MKTSSFIIHHNGRLRSMSVSTKTTLKRAMDEYVVEVLTHLLNKQYIVSRGNNSSDVEARFLLTKYKGEAGG